MMSKEALLNAVKRCTDNTHFGFSFDNKELESIHIERADRIIRNQQINIFVKPHVAPEFKPLGEWRGDGKPCIILLPKKMHPSIERFYRIAFHELAHHQAFLKGILDRDFFNNPHARRIEEITAEITALLCCEQLGITLHSELLESISYIKSYANNFPKWEMFWDVCFNDAMERTKKIVDFDSLNPVYELRL